MKEERQKKRMLRVLAAVYLAALVWIILFKMALSPEQLPSLRNVNLIPFGDALVVNGKADYGEVFQNLLIFVPFGVYLQMLFPRLAFWKKAALAAGASLILEILQFILAVGASDITDLLANTLGAIAGVAGYLLLEKLLGKRTGTVVTVLASVATIGMCGLIVLLFAAN